MTITGAQIVFIWEGHMVILTFLKAQVTPGLMRKEYALLYVLEPQAA